MVMVESSHGILMRGVLASVWSGLLTVISFAGMLRYSGRSCKNRELTRLPGSMNVPPTQNFACQH